MSSPRMADPRRPLVRVRHCVFASILALLGACGNGEAPPVDDGRNGQGVSRSPQEHDVFAILLKSGGPETWRLSDEPAATDEGVALYRKLPSRVIGHSSLPRRLSVTWAPNAFPHDSQEKGRIHAFEYRMNAALEKGRLGLKVLIDSSELGHTWLVYCRDGEGVSRSIERFREESAAFPVTFEEAMDPRWEAYRRHVPGSSR